MTGWNGALDDETLNDYAKNFLERQQGQLGALKAMPEEMVLQNYHRFLDALEDQLKKSFFLFGDRPTLAEFGLFGQLSQYIVDPTVSTIIRERAVCAYQWTHYIDDLSGIEPGDWWPVKDCLGLKQELKALDAEDRNSITDFLMSCGCWDALQSTDEEAAHVSAILPG